MIQALTTAQAREMTPWRFLQWADAQVKPMVVDGKAASSRRKYEHAIDDFLAWVRTHWEVGQEIGEQPTFTKATLTAYKRHLVEKRGLAPQTVNGYLAAIRGLVRGAADLGALDPRLAESIAGVKNAEQRGTRFGNWLDKETAQALLNAPDPETTKGIRDRAILGLLVGVGLRRDEVARLTWEHLQAREGHHVLADITGKHGRIRTVKVPPWLYRRLMTWRDLLPVHTGAMFWSVRKGDRLDSPGLTAQAVYNLVAEYAPPDVAPHDLRRTFAKLARKGGAPLEQIQFILGHASIVTTERYVGADLDLDDCAVDYTGLGG